VPPQVSKTRVLDLIEDGRFDDMLEPMGHAILKRMKLVKARDERAEKLKKRREKANAARKGTGVRK
jgi:hypothetical protein